MKQYERAVSELDAFIEHSHSENKEAFNPLHFVGNGKLGTVVKDGSSLYLFYEVLVQHTDNKKHQKVMREEQRALRLPFRPIIKMRHMAGLESEASASVINLREGIVESLSCFKLEEYSRNCIFVNHTVVAHRSRPNLFLQHIRATVDGSSGAAGMKVDDIPVVQDEFAESMHFKRAAGNLFNHKPYKLYSGVIEVGKNQYMAVAVASHITGRSLHVSSDNSNHIDAMTVVMHSDIKTQHDEAKREEEIVQKRAANYANEVTEMSTDELLKEHRAAWKDILHTGLTISTAEREPGIPDPMYVNATLYYVLSSSDSKLHDEGIPEKERRDLINRLQTPDFCYQGHPTFHGQSLWTPVQTVEDVANLQRLWSLTLSKQNCMSLVSEGAEGLLQAMLLSFGGLKFTENDLRLGTDPDVLHNDIAFHRLVYRNDTLDIVVKRGSADGNPVISVTLREPSKIPLYACEAGCMHEAVELGIVPQEIPVFVTDPVTSILYISHDRNHLSDLRHTLHVRKIIDHAEHMEAVRKGTGLPTIFWVGIGSLIFFFHMFLIRLMCNEYKSSTYSAPHYGGSGGIRQFSSRGRLAS